SVIVARLYDVCSSVTSRKYAPVIAGCLPYFNAVKYSIDIHALISATAVVVLPVPGSSLQRYSDLDRSPPSRCLRNVFTYSSMILYALACSLRAGYDFNVMYRYYIGIFV